MKNFDYMDPIKSLWNFWNRIPEQTKRLTIIFVIFVVLLIAARSILVPSDFGKYGHFRASAVNEIVSQEIHYAGHEICNECHDGIVEIKSEGYHRNVACEVCHGPAAAHTEDPEAAELQAPRGRGYCPICHEFLPSRPTGFPQIVSASHNPIKPCITCHEPHDPKPPQTPKECTACHATIARSKSISHHAYVPCTRCHEAPEEHKVSPRQFLPSKPQDRKFCGGCHAVEATSDKGIPRIDMITHGERYVCWQCHYPHLPEAR
ncbi:MAG: cytochrome c3 family protein [bacterium]